MTVERLMMYSAFTVHEACFDSADLNELSFPLRCHLLTSAAFFENAA